MRCYALLLYIQYNTMQYYWCYYYYYFFYYY